MYCVAIMQDVCFAIYGRTLIIAISPAPTLGSSLGRYGLTGASAVFKLLLLLPFPQFIPKLVLGTRAKEMRRHYFCHFSTCFCGCSRQIISMSCTCLPFSFPCIAPAFILSSPMQRKKKPFLLSFSYKGWLAERVQQQTSDLLLPSISYPQTLVSLFPISRKMNSCSHPSYPRLKHCYETLKGLGTCLKTRMLVLFLEAECTVNRNSLMFKK